MRLTRHRERSTPDNTSFVRRIIKNQVRAFYTHQTSIPTATNRRTNKIQVRSIDALSHMRHTSHISCHAKGRICGRQGTDGSGHVRCTVRSNVPITLKKKTHACSTSSRIEMSALQRPKTTIQSQPLGIARKRVR